MATVSSHTIVSAAGSPAPTQSLTYSIEGSGIVVASTLASSSARSTITSDSAVLDGTSLTTSKDHRLSTPAVLGVVVAVLFAIIGTMMLTLFLYKRKRQVVSRAQRKSIMDAEFAASRPCLQIGRPQKSSIDKSEQIGYFDVAKPLPAVTPDRQVEDDTLSRSSTIIADAAEVAQINRKMSTHQARNKKSREQVRAKNHALQILITNADNRTSVLHSPLTSNPTTPVDYDLDSPVHRTCADGDGDTFARRVSKF